MKAEWDPTSKIKIRHCLRAHPLSLPLLLSPKQTAAEATVSVSASASPRRLEGVATMEERATVRMTNIPQTVIAKDLLHYLESQLGKDSVFAVEILTERKNWKSRGFGRVQFTSLEFKRKAESLSNQNSLVFKSHNLKVSETYDDIIPRPILAHNRMEDGVLHVGFLEQERSFCLLETWNNVRGWVMPERRRLEFWVVKENEDEKYLYKLEVKFEDILEAVGYCPGGDRVDGLLLKLRYGPRIYKRISGPNIASKFSTDRYHICKEDFDFIWVRTTDFSATKSIGRSTSFFWELEEGKLGSDTFANFPSYREDTLDLEDLVDWRGTFTSSEIVPLVECESELGLPFEILFQLNSLVHTQKITLAAFEKPDLINNLSGLNINTALIILQKLRKSEGTCYDSVEFVKRQLRAPSRNLRTPPPLSQITLKSHNIMRCYRALITPLKIYCLGPELETSNYVVRRFADYASSFMRVTFVEEDWSKLPANAISTSIQEGIFAKPYRTEVYHRILSVLRDGILIGDKRYEYLAFSASQLRSNSVWMFASNENLRAEDIRKWMGFFSGIRSVSMCAARMGQLFSSSHQTFTVPIQDIEIIPDIEVTSDGIGYCFSDGIGKISHSFARQVAQKCGLKDTPSAFQIRYGGYKGVIAADRNSFRKLSLRSSMLKFESEARMLNVIKWSESMPCFLNREIVSLLSTLGVNDEAFEVLLEDQLCKLGRMLHSKQAALDVLESLGWADSRNILVKMLLHGYEPSVEPYLSMMLQAYHDNMLKEMRNRCRILVPKGRLLIGCLDETGILDYGQVFVHLTMTKSELQSGDRTSFRRVSETTCILTGKVVVAQNPCLHPGDIRVLAAVYEVELEEKGLVDCILFPQNGERPHPNECSGGDLDGDQFFVCWDQNLIPSQTVNAMDYIGGRPRIMDHDVTLEEIHKFFVDYMINDTLGAISTAHLVYADREPDKALSRKCLELANLHSLAVDFAKTGAPAEMPRALKPKEFPDFMEREDKPMYISNGVLGKLYRATVKATAQERSNFFWSKEIAEVRYDHDLEVQGFRDFIELANSHKETYTEKLSELMNYYEAKTEDEILTGNLRSKASYLQRDNRRYGETKDRILVSVKTLQKEAKQWLERYCQQKDHPRLASAWYHVTYHPDYCHRGVTFLSFPWVVADILLNIKSVNTRRGAAAHE